MTKCRIPLILAGVALVAACSDQPVSGPDLRAAAPPGAVSVLNWNIYVGTNVDAIIDALISSDPDLVKIVLAQLDTLFLTDFSSRAQAIADEIAARRPHAVGLQEVTTFDLSAVGLPELVFMDTLKAALAQRGLNYVVADSVMNIDATVEIAPGTGLNMKDFDFMLVDADRVTLLGTFATTFQYNLVDIIPPALLGGIEIRRGYVLATVSIDGDVYTIVSTHPEPDLGPYDFSALREGQAMEIVWALGQANTDKAIVMGDLNDVVGSDLYDVFADAGFVDAWAEMRPSTVGNTCCHLTSLSNPLETFTKRIDYVLVRGIGHPQAGLQGHIDRLGDVPADKVDGPVYPIWPSDHAGLFAEFGTGLYRTTQDVTGGDLNRPIESGEHLGHGAFTGTRRA